MFQKPSNFSKMGHTNGVSLPWGLFFLKRRQTGCATISGKPPAAKNSGSPPLTTRGALLSGGVIITPLPSDNTRSGGLPLHPQRRRFSPLPTVPGRPSSSNPRRAGNLHYACATQRDDTSRTAPPPLHPTVPP